MPRHLRVGTPDALAAWFVVLFGEPWAREYGAESRQAHTADIPGYTYGVQALCTALQVVTLVLVHRALGIAGIGDALLLGVLIAIGFCVANILPGQAFLKRWRVAAITAGCQSAMILAFSIILGGWQ